MNAWDSFYAATLELVRSSPIKQRLVAAFSRHLAQLPAEHMPSEVRAPFSQVINLLQGVQPQRGEDAVSASVRKMSNQEAEDCAALIVEIFGVMCKTYLTALRPNAVVPMHPPEEHGAEEFDIPALIASH